MFKKRVDRTSRIARIWSNEQLRILAPCFSGAIVNVSAGDDIDKQGGFYIDYFSQHDSYTLTNYLEGSFRGFKARKNELHLDLTKPLDGSLQAKFDVVFNHTTIEHVFDVFTAFTNLCAMTNDVVILVVPFSQLQHESEDFLDYWRFTPSCLRELFRREGLEVVYEAANDDLNSAIYLVFVAARDPVAWKRKLPKYQPIEVAGSWLGHQDLLVLDLGFLRRAKNRLMSPVEKVWHKISRFHSFIHSIGLLRSRRFR